uniref:Uncharacterized protein n=1 Tax=Leptocylindrus danicus TaxID=163516 RepID=A0A7S2L2E7_9STRA
MLLAQPSRYRREDKNLSAPIFNKHLVFVLCTKLFIIGTTHTNQPQYGGYRRSIGCITETNEDTMMHQQSNGHMETVFLGGAINHALHSLIIDAISFTRLTISKDL